MGVTAISGPHLVYGLVMGSTGQVQEYNEERGPSIYDLGTATCDPRYQFMYDPGAPVGTQVKAFFDQMGTVDYIPFTATTSAFNNSSATQPVAGTALTLVPISSQGAFQTTIIAPETGQSVSVIAIDSTASVLPFATGGTVAVWNPNGGTGRAISVVNTSNANTEQYIVRGRDMYGFKMTETILASTTSSGTGVGRKAFKYITSVTPSTATTISATGVAVGFADIFGLPLRAAYMSGISVWNSTTPHAASLMTLSSANSVSASTAATQTSTTPDVRGTIASTFASNGSSATISSTGPAANINSTAVRLTIMQQINAVMVATVTASDTSVMLGVTQFSDF